MPTAIVIGGAGFMGSHLVDRLVAESWHVIVIDNTATGSWSNLGHLGESSLTRLSHDITDPLSKVLKDLKDIDVVVHMASPASPVHYRRLALETLRVNSVGTENALRLSWQTGARFVYASTSEVYGDPEVSPQTETYWGHVNPVGLRACYDESKRFGEALTMEYQRQYGLDVRIVRFFNCYGPRMQLEDGRVVPNFIKQALLGQPLTIYGSGNQTRSFCFVEDTVDAVYRIMTRDGISGQIINVGNPSETTIAGFAGLVARVAGVPLRVSHGALPPDDPTNRRPDISKAQALLDWSPKIDLLEGLSRTLDYFRPLVGNAHTMSCDNAHLVDSSF